MDKFREWLRGKELNEMSPVMMMGNAPFGSLANMSKSQDAMKSDFDKISDFKDGYLVFKHKRLELIIIAKEYDDLVLKERRWAIIAELSFKIKKVRSSNRLISNKEAVMLHTINVNEANRRDKFATRLYLLLAQYYIVISDSIQYEGAVKLWKSFTRIPGIKLYIWNEKEDKIISKMTAKTNDNAIWSNGDLGDYSKMNTRLILSLKD